MNLEELLRDASAELRDETDVRPIPVARFVATDHPSRTNRRRFALAMLACIAVIGFAVRVIVNNDDRDSGRVDTTSDSSTTTTTTTTTTRSIEDEAPPNFVPPPAALPDYVGSPSIPSDVLARWGVAVELSGEAGVSDATRGRIIRQEPPGGTPLTAGMTVTFTIGPRLAILDGEFEIGAGPTSTKGAWRILVSTAVGFHQLHGSKYTLVFLSETSAGFSTGSGIDAKQRVNSHDAFGGARLIVGEAPPEAATIELVDARGDVVGSVATKRFDHPDLQHVSFFLIEADQHPSYSRLRALDQRGTIVAEQPGR